MLYIIVDKAGVAWEEDGNAHVLLLLLPPLFTSSTSISS